MGVQETMSQETSSLTYHRILLKLSGEALCSQNVGFGIDAETVRRIATEIKRVHDLGVEVALVIGGGNIWRGADAAATGIDRATADRSEEHTSELQSPCNLVCRLLLEKKKKKNKKSIIS